MIVQWLHSSTTALPLWSLNVVRTPFGIAACSVTDARETLCMQTGGYEKECWWETEETRADGSRGERFRVAVQTAVSQILLRRS